MRYKNNILPAVIYSVFIVPVVLSAAINTHDPIYSQASDPEEDHAEKYNGVEEISTTDNPASQDPEINCTPFTADDVKELTDDPIWSDIQCFGPSKNGMYNCSHDGMDHPSAVYEKIHQNMKDTQQKFNYSSKPKVYYNRIYYNPSTPYMVCTYTLQNNKVGNKNVHDPSEDEQQQPKYFHPYPPKRYSQYVPYKNRSRDSASKPDRRNRERLKNNQRATQGPDYPEYDETSDIPQEEVPEQYSSNKKLGNTTRKQKETPIDSSRVNPSDKRKMYPRTSNKASSKPISGDADDTPDYTSYGNSPNEQQKRRRSFLETPQQISIDNYNESLPNDHENELNYQSGGQYTDNQSDMHSDNTPKNTETPENLQQRIVMNPLEDNEEDERQGISKDSTQPEFNDEPEPQPNTDKDTSSQAIPVQNLTEGHDSTNNPQDRSLTSQLSDDLKNQTINRNSMENDKNSHNNREIHLDPNQPKLQKILENKEDNDQQYSANHLNELQEKHPSPINDDEHTINEQEKPANNNMNSQNQGNLQSNPSETSGVLNNRQDKNLASTNLQGPGKIIPHKNLYKILGNPEDKNETQSDPSRQKTNSTLRDGDKLKGRPQSSIEPSNDKDRQSSTIDETEPEYGDQRNLLSETNPQNHDNPQRNPSEEKGRANNPENKYLQSPNLDNSEKHFPQNNSNRLTGNNEDIKKINSGPTHQKLSTTPVNGDKLNDLMRNPSEQPSQFDGQHHPTISNAEGEHSDQGKPISEMNAQNQRNPPAKASPENSRSSIPENQTLTSPTTDGTPHQRPHANSNKHPGTPGDNRNIQSGPNQHKLNSTPMNGDNLNGQTQKSAEHPNQLDGRHHPLKDNTESEYSDQRKPLSDMNGQNQRNLHTNPKEENYGLNNIDTQNKTSPTHDGSKTQFPHNNPSEQLGNSVFKKGVQLGPNQNKLNSTPMNGDKLNGQPQTAAGKPNHLDGRHHSTGGNAEPEYRDQRKPLSKMNGQGNTSPQNGGSSTPENQTLTSPTTNDVGNPFAHNHSNKQPETPHDNKRVQPAPNQSKLNSTPINGDKLTDQPQNSTERPTKLDGRHPPTESNDELEYTDQGKPIRDRDAQNGRNPHLNPNAENGGSNNPEDKHLTYPIHDGSDNEFPNNNPSKLPGNPDHKKGVQTGSNQHKLNSTPMNGDKFNGQPQNSAKQPNQLDSRRHPTGGNAETDYRDQRKPLSDMDGQNQRNPRTYPTAENNVLNNPEDDQTLSSPITDGPGSQFSHKNPNKHPGNRNEKKRVQSAPNPQLNSTAMNGDNLSGQPENFTDQPNQLDSQHHPTEGNAEPDFSDQGKPLSDMNGQNQRNVHTNPSAENDESSNPGDNKTLRSPTNDGPKNQFSHKNPSKQRGNPEDKNNFQSYPNDQSLDYTPMNGDKLSGRPPNSTEPKNHFGNSMPPHPNRREADQSSPYPYRNQPPHQKESPNVNPDEPPAVQPKNQLKAPEDQRHSSGPSARPLPPPVREFTPIVHICLPFGNQFQLPGSP